MVVLNLLWALHGGSCFLNLPLWCFVLIFCFWPRASLFSPFKFESIRYNFQNWFLKVYTNLTSSFHYFCLQKPPIFSYDNLTSFSQIGTKYAIRLTLCIGHDATSFAVLGSINMLCSATFKEDLATITLCNKFWLCVYFVCAVTVWSLSHNRSHSFSIFQLGLECDYSTERCVF